MYANTCSEWIRAMGTIINAQMMYSKYMPTVITAPLCMKFLVDLAAPCCVCPTLHSPILPIIAHHHPTAVNNESTIFQGDDDMHDYDSSTSTIEKGGGLIAVTGIMQTIAVIVNNIAS